MRHNEQYQSHKHFHSCPCHTSPTWQMTTWTRHEWMSTHITNGGNQVVILRTISALLNTPPSRCSLWRTAALYWKHAADIPVDFKSSEKYSIYFCTFWNFCPHCWRCGHWWSGTIESYMMQLVKVFSKRVVYMWIFQNYRRRQSAEVVTSSSEVCLFHCLHCL